MQSGKFKHLITVQRRNRRQTEVGDVEETWTDLPGFARIFGEVLPDRAQEFFAGRQVQATMNALIRLYYQPDIDETMRVIHHIRPGLDDYYDIQGVIPFQSNQRELRLMCLKREAEGYRRGTDLANVDDIESSEAPDIPLADSSFIFADSTDITADAT